MIFEDVSQLTLLYYKYQMPHQVVTINPKWRGGRLMVLLKTQLENTFYFLFVKWWLLTIHKQQLHNSLYNDKRAAWEPAIWFMFGIFRQACRQMDAPLVVYYCVRVTPSPPLWTSLPAKSHFCHTTGVKARSVSVGCWFDWSRWERSDRGLLSVNWAQRQTEHLDRPFT